MNYPIEVLRRTIEKHKSKLDELSKVDHEMHASVVFTDNEIINHKDCIKQLEKAIEKLLIN